MDKIQEMKQLTKQLMNITSQMSNLWEDDRVAEFMHQHEINSKYPFRDDFMSVMIDISSWAIQIGNSTPPPSEEEIDRQLDFIHSAGTKPKFRHEYADYTEEMPDRFKFLGTIKPMDVSDGDTIELYEIYDPEGNLSCVSGVYKDDDTSHSIIPKDCILDLAKRGSHTALGYLKIKRNSLV